MLTSTQETHNMKKYNKMLCFKCFKHQITHLHLLLLTSVFNKKITLHGHFIH